MSTTRELGCTYCGALRGAHEVVIAGRGPRYWHDPCTCPRALALQRSDAEIEASRRRVAIYDQQQRANAARREYGDDSLERNAGLNWTLASFRRELVTGPGRQPHPLDVALDWLQAAQAYDHPTWDPYLPPGAHAQYDDPASPPAALYLVGTPGVGKSHLANALGELAAEAGRSVKSINEAVYLNRFIGDFAGRSALVERLNKAWLLIIDDIGQWEDQDKATVARAYYALINARWEKQKWTIFTSNYALSQLLAMGIINAATESRMAQMFKMRPVQFLGADQRMVVRKGA